MGKIVVDLHLDDLRIDHDEAQGLRSMLEEQARDDGVDADALAASRGPRNQKMRHRRQIGDDRMAVHILAERQRQRRLGRLPGLALKKFPDTDLHLAGIGDLDANGVLAGDRR